MSDEPDFLTDLQQSAVAFHEMFTAWREAGFTEEQAMQMLCTVITTQTQAVIMMNAGMLPSPPEQGETP